MSRIAGLLGGALLALNLVGLFIPPRAPDLTDEYADFARASTLPYREADARLDRLRAETDPELIVTEATRVFHEGLAHVREDDIRRQGYPHYRLVIAPWDNWLLYGLDFLKPGYLEDGYHFCSYRRALRRGVGWCEQKSMALTGYLEERGFETGVIELGGHVVATARVGEKGWYLLDADYGAVIPFDLEAAEAEPARVMEYYWTAAAQERRISRYFGADSNSVAYGGPEVRYPKACPIERAAYGFKWAIPLGLCLFFLVGTATSCKGA